MPSAQDKFISLLGIKPEPNAHELVLFQKTKKYIPLIAWIPGIEMIAVVNSLSMYATHQDSDIDLFFLTRPGYLWLVRVVSTVIFWICGMWRHDQDIAGHFCLSFFTTTRAIDMSRIAIRDDIYLENWARYLKPIFARSDIYDRFLSENTWVSITEMQKSENLQYAKKAPKEKIFFEKFWIGLSRMFEKCLLPKTLASYEKKGRPTGVIISSDMLKFHDQDRREQIRDQIHNTEK